MLGTLAFQDADGAYIETVRGATALEALSKDIADTAVDVFVYDTRKDSDGGAWRQRTQHTSWYNETLNTATRGARREFPAVAVIVSQTQKLTIYDGDDPDMPMWMTFASGSGTAMIRGSVLPKIAAKNGVIALTNSSLYGGLIAIHFISDTSKSYRAISSANNTEGYFSSNIANRDSSSYSNNSGGFTLPAIVSENTNDVAMTVLPNAPIDSATGLPVPTIAVATSGGVSVIRDDGMVVDYTRGASNEFTGSVAFDENYDLIISWGTSAGGYRHITRLTYPFSDSSSFDVTYGYVASDAGLGSSAAGGVNGVVKIDNTGRHFGIDYDSTQAGNTDDRLGFLHLNSSDTSKSLVAFATTSYNTGWMHGNIKGAFLSDTDATNITRNNLSGDSFPTTKTFGQRLLLSGPLTSGTLYEITYTITSSDYTGDLYFEPSNSPFSYEILQKSVGTYTILRRAVDSTDTSLFSLGGAAGQTGSITFSDVFVTKAEEDRSVNDKGLQVFGTITKTPVATGAELVAYGSFSASNYLVQPNITPPGTGDFSLSFWIRPETFNAGVGNYFHLFSLGTKSIGGQGSGTGFVLKMTTTSSANSSGYGTYFYSSDGTTDKGTFASENHYKLGIWSHCVAMRKSGIPYFYINGVLVRTGASWTQNITDTYLTMGVGIGYSEYGGDAKVSLLRYSLSAPSPEQIRKIYEDEKVLFQGNAACTLYGSSNAVTALAYDDTTSLLHVGTSSGRSEFKGLRRVANTTTAVTTAISASNGLVAEQ
jgi:hypothetical protein